MNSYSQYPNLWTPPYYPNLFVVKSPDRLTQLDEKTYFDLMQKRLSWMIETWTTDESPQSARQMLIAYVMRTAPAQSPPLLPDDLEDESAMIDWREDWAEAIILHNDTFRVRLRLEAMGKEYFPVQPIDQASPDFQGLLELHERVNLSEWLTYLS